VQTRIALGARILTNALSQVAAALGLPVGTAGFRAVRVSRYPKPLAVLVALIALAFTATTLQAQSLAPTQLREFDTAVRPVISLETYRQPVITCTVGRAGFLGNAGRQAPTIEMVVARGVAYIVLGGVIFALVASFRLLSDKVDSFFALLIPEPTGTRSLRTIPPLDEDFSPFQFEVKLLSHSRN